MIKLVYKEWFDDHINEIKNTPDYVASGLMIEITNRFVERMEQIGITQEMLATKLHLKQPYISKILNHDTNMTLQTIAKIAVALDLEVKAPVFIPKEQEYSKFELYKNEESPNGESKNECALAYAA